MAKKKREDAPAPGSPAWMATFSDLMNLLLCFFVLLFSMSSVDQAKFDALAQSLASTFSIFQAGGRAFGDGYLVSSGASQLNNLDEYYNSMGQASDESSGEEVFENTKDPDAIKQHYEQIIEDLKGQLEKTDYEQQQLANKTSAAYDEISDLVERYNLGSYLELNADTMYNYVVISVRGSILFESGSAALAESAKPVLAKIGEVLKLYAQCDVEIIGHTDNVPISSARFRNNRELSQARALSTAEYLIEQNHLDERKVYYTGRGEIDPIDSNDTEEGRRHNRRIEIRLYMTGRQ